MCRSAFAVVLLVVVSMAPATDGKAATLRVQPDMEVRDNGSCSLPEAIQNANQDRRVWADCAAGSGADRLELEPNYSYRIARRWPDTGSGLPVIFGELEIVGDDTTLERDSAEAFRLLEVVNGDVRISRLMMANGLSDGTMVGGGAIHVFDSRLELDQVELVGNRAAGMFRFGGAIRMDQSEVTMVDSLLTDNEATSFDPEHGGGAIAQFNGQLTIRRSALLDNVADLTCDLANPDGIASTGGALRVEATADTGAQSYIFDTTIANNIARVGGGIHLVAIADTGVGGIQDVFVQLTRTTVVFNQAVSCGALIGQGDGIQVQEFAGGTGLVAFGNTILHGNGRPFMGDIVGTDCSANAPSSRFISLEGNVLDDDDNCPGGGFDVFEGQIDSVIDPVRVVTHFVPRASGPAVDFFEAGVNCPPGEPDQLGNPRAGGPGQGGSLCDVGAIELQPVGERFTLSVTVDGAGVGEVESQPLGIDCPDICTVDFDEGTMVELFAAPAGSASFAGWSGACSGAGSCTVTMDQSRSITATFDGPSSFPLNVVVLGGDAAVTSNPAGIDCPGSCSASFPADALVELIQTPAPGFSFTGWGGSCAGDDDCFVVMNQARTVTANYTNVETSRLDVAVIGAGAVTSLPARIDCLPLCAAEFATTETVQLVAEPSAGSTFVGWSGDCSGTGACTFSLAVDRQVTATFSTAPVTNPLEVSIGGGSGSVVSSPGGIDCPGTCATEFPDGTGVQLTPAPAAGFAFDGWTGDCSGDGACFLTLNESKSVTAFFIAENTLSVSIAGSGSVTSMPAGIDCPDDCSAGFVPAEKVLLVPSPINGASFIEWTGACSGSGACVVDMGQPRSVTATFSEPGFALHVVLDGDGSGQVFDVPTPGSIDCPGTCSATFPAGEAVTLDAVADGGSVFQSFASDCQGTTCSVTMDRDRTVRATFLSPQQLFVDSFE